MFRNFCLSIAVLALLSGAFPVADALAASPLITVVKPGAKKDAVSLARLNATGPNGRLFVQTLTRDLELSGWFTVAQNGSVNVSGTVADAGGGIQTRCDVSWAGKRFGWARVSSGQTEVRRQAHQLADEMVKQIAGKKGIAQSKITFVNRRGANRADVYVCDANGMGVLQLTRDNVAAVGPRWAPNGHDIYYTSFLHGYPAIYRINQTGGYRKALAPFRGLNTGADISPDGSRAALILSYQGNPELYVLSLSSGRIRRLTNTPHGAEASPCWSPDGRCIAYVSDATGKPQIYVVDVASGHSRRLTYKGTENVNPDWGPNGQIAYATKRSGYEVAIMGASGDGSSRIIPGPGGECEHPSWAPDGRHLVCSCRSALYLLDVEGDPPVRLFNIPGNWLSPDWSDK